MILDGRNRYLACKMFSIPPKFKGFPNTIDPLFYVVSKNLKRRHLNSAQLCEIGLKLLELEKRKAKERQIRSQFGKKDKNDILKEDYSVGDLGIPTMKDSKKGRAIDITTSQIKVAPKTLRKANKIKEMAKIDSSINNQWKKAEKDEVSIESVYKEVKEKEKEKNRRIPNNSPAHKILENIEMDNISSLEEDPIN